MQTAVARRGVAVIVYCLEISPRRPRRLQASAVTVFLSSIQSSRRRSKSCRNLAAILNRAKKVTIFGGAGCKGAHAELLAIAAGKLKSPIVHALRGKEFIEYDNPFDVGLTGLLGFSSGYHAMMNSDTLLMLGTDFPYQDFYPKHATIIQVDISGEQLGRRTKLDLGVVGDVRQTLKALLPKLNQKTESDHLDRAVGHYKATRKGLDDLAIDKPVEGPLHPQFLTKAVSDAADADAIFTCDVGSPVLWAARYITMNGQRRLLGSFNHGSMANALTQAIGAQACQTGRQVVALCGDGGLAMMMGDLLTLKQLNLPVKVIVFRNDTLGFVELEMKSMGIIEFGTNLVNPDFAKIAEASGLLGLRVDRPAQLGDALKKAFAHDGPALVEVLVKRQEISVPPSVTIAQAKGFSLYMMRAVLNGRADEVLDLMNVNTVKESIAVGKEMVGL